MRYAIAIMSVAVSAALSASVPLRWTVETSRAQVAQFDAYRGETLALEAALNSYGKPLEGVLQPTLYWQTNGMGAAWWTATATASGNVLRATWSPTNDCGATAYNCFIGGPESTYRAAFRLRMLPSPGFTPNALPLPTVTHDAALFGEPTINGTNLTEWVSARSQAENDPLFSEWVRTNDFSSAGGTAAGVDTNAVNDLISSAMDVNEGVGTRRQIIRGSNEFGPWDIEVFGAQTAQTAQGDADGRPIVETYAEKVQVDDLVGQVNSLGDHYNELSGTVSAWQTYWDGDDVRVTVTNYYGTLDIPSLYIEQKMPAGDGHDAPWFRSIWDERTRWNGFLQAYSALTNHVYANLADRAWGVYDSSSGADSPDGLLQLSQDQIMIAPGMSYQKTVTAGGCAVWVLQSTGTTMLTGEGDTGYFRLSDGDGNALIEVVKGDKRVVGATATGVEMHGNAMTVRYNSASDDHPTLEICTDLRAANWETETETRVATVAWSGSSGAWVATVTPIGDRPALFAKATYEAGGNTYIRNNVASSLDKVVVGGIEYTVTVETVNGKKLMVLR